MDWKLGGLAIAMAAACLAPASVQARVDVKGVPVAITQDQLLTWPGLDVSCGTISKSKHEGPSNVICSTRSPQGTFQLYNDTFANGQVQIAYWIYDGIVAEISIAPLPSSRFDGLLGVLQAKYGPAKVRVSKLKNRLGAEFDNSIATWVIDGDVIEFNQFGNNLDHSSLRFTSREYMAVRASWQAGNKASAVDDI